MDNIIVQTLYETSSSTPIYFDEIVKNLQFDENHYELLCCTTHKNGHFCAFYNIENRTFFIDDLKSDYYTENLPNLHRITTCFYYLK
jgi:hypothetical protein